MNIQHYNDFILSEDFLLEDDITDEGNLDLQIKLLESEIAELEEVALNERINELFSIKRKRIKSGKLSKLKQLSKPGHKIRKPALKGATWAVTKVLKLAYKLLKKLLFKKRKLKASKKSTISVERKIFNTRNKIRKLRK